MEKIGPGRKHVGDLARQPRDAFHALALRPQLLVEDDVQRLQLGEALVEGLALKSS